MRQVSIQASQQRLSMSRARTRRPGPRRQWTWRKRGQALVIFALTITFLMGLTGLAIDVVRAYDLYARELRAAEAGALAGDLYMPCFYNSITSGASCGSGASPDNNTAQSVAMAEVQKDGFGSGVTPPATCSGADTTAAVTVCTNSTSTTALEVTVTQPINVFFLAVIGIPSLNVSATAAADYLPNTILGSGGGGGGNVWGSGGVSNPKTFLAVINGPAEFQEQGDPFVYCQQGPTAGPPADGDFSTAAIALLDKTTNTTAGFNTNHAAFAGNNSECGGAKDPNNLQPYNLTGPNTAAGNDVYSFQISSKTGGDIWIWNPIFDPSDPQSSCNGSQFVDTFFTDQSCANYYQQYGSKLKPATTGTKNPPSFDDPRFYFDLVYSLYSFNPVFNNKPGSPIAGPITASPADLYGADVSAHCTAGGNAYLPPVPPALEGSTYAPPVLPALPGTVPGTCATVNGPGFQAGQWVDMFPGVKAGPYRLAIEALSHYPADGCGTFTCGWGRHVYSIAFCAAGSTPSKGSCPAPDATAIVSPVNDADLYLNFPSGTQNGAIPIADIPTSYAGRTITFSVFNPGYTRANAPNTYFTIVPPDCSPISITSNVSNNWYRTSNQGVPTAAPPCSTGGTGGTYNWVFAAALGKGTTTGDFIYHGLWVDIPVKIPSSYKNTASTQWWFVENVGNGSKDFGQICLKVSVNNGSPVHLIL